MITILGEHIRLIRPEKVLIPRIWKDEMPVIKYNKRSKRVKESSGKVIALTIMLKGNNIVRKELPCIHAQIIEGIDFDLVINTGWVLEGERYIWR